MKQILSAIGVFILIFLVYSSFHPKWSIFYYPDGCLTCEDKYIIQVDAFESREQCRDAGYNMRKLRENYEDTFECGSKCKYDESFYLCKTTEDF